MNPMISEYSRLKQIWNYFELFVKYLMIFEHLVKHITTYVLVLFNLGMEGKLFIEYVNDDIHVFFRLSCFFLRMVAYSR